MSALGPSMPRIVEAELLDSLPADDARAVRSRRDLVRVNAFMRNAGIVARALRLSLPARCVRVAEIGAGDGAFALAVARRLPQGGRMWLLDRQADLDPALRPAFATHGWEVEAARADVFEWLADPATPRFDAVFANLFLHHFEPPQLQALLRLVAARTPLFVACEPRRSRTALAGSRMLGLIGCNAVTRHDAVASVHAGFRGGEISSLWDAGPGWFVEEQPRGLFSHAFVAERA